VDPDGEIAWFIPVIAGAIIGAYTGASIQSHTAAFWNWKSDSWKGAIAGAFVGASIGLGISSALGEAATGMYVNGVEGLISTSFSTTSTIVNGGTSNMILSLLGGTKDKDLWKASLSGAIMSWWTISGGFGLVTGFGSKSKVGKVLGSMLYEMVGTTGRSIGYNWTNNVKRENFKITLGVGPINLTLGRKQKLFQVSNNIFNLLINGIGLTNTLFGGSIDFDIPSLSMVYYGGFIQKIDERFGGEGFGCFAMLLNGNVDNSITLRTHEMHHIWQSRSVGDSFLFHYLFDGIKALVNPYYYKNSGIKSIVDGLNGYEQIAYSHKWF
jgi:hypothetical protein